MVVDAAELGKWVLWLLAAGGGAIQILRYLDERRHLRTYLYVSIYEDSDGGIKSQVQASVHNDGGRRVYLRGCSFVVGGSSVMPLRRFARIIPPLRAHIRRVRAGKIFAVAMGNASEVLPVWLEPGESKEFRDTLLALAGRVQGVIDTQQLSATCSELMRQSEVLFTEGSGHGVVGKLDFEGRAHLNRWCDMLAHNEKIRRSRQP